MINPQTYEEWRDTIPSFELDGEVLYLPTGDVPVTEEELRQSWERMNRPADDEDDEDCTDAPSV